MTRYNVYDNGKEIGVLFRESSKKYHHYPLAYQGSIEDTYDLAQCTCDVLNAFGMAHLAIPKYLDQFIEERSRHKPMREEYLSDLRLFLQFGLPDTCGQCRFFIDNKPCKHQYSTGLSVDYSYPCACGIRKDQNND